MVEKIKKILVLTIILIMTSVVLLANFSNTYATSEIDYRYIEKNLLQLKTEILEYGANGFINTNGNSYIIYEIDGQSFSMSYDYNTDTINCTAILENGENFHGVSMDIDGVYNDSLYPTVVVTIGNTDGFTAKAELSIADYTFDKTLYFNIETATDEFFYGSSTQNLCNSHLALAISGWQLLLSHRTSLSLENIGFTSLCSGHSFTYTKQKTPATLSQNGYIKNMCVYCGKLETKTIYYPKTISLSKTSFTYNKKVQKPTVTVVGSDGKTISTSNYTVKYSNANSKKVGRYKVTITFKGNYTGTKTLTYDIKPKGTSLKKLTKGKKQFKAEWKAQKTETTGYEIQYATNNKFTSGKKSVNIKSNKTTSKTIKKLKKNKKYYVRIRTYKTVKFDGKNIKIYSGWSKILNVKTK